MNDVFQKRVRAAAVAGWWVVLIGIGFILLQWVIFLAVLRVRPGWFLAMWGPNVDWVFIHAVWFWAIAILKFFLWLLTFVVLWLTLWARQLKFLAPLVQVDLLRAERQRLAPGSEGDDLHAQNA